jgi:hypothetical protein
VVYEEQPFLVEILETVSRCLGAPLGQEFLMVLRAAASGGPAISNAAVAAREVIRAWRFSMRV